MTTNHVTLSDAMAKRAAGHNEANALLSQIEAAQNTLLAMHDKLTRLNTASSFCKAVSDVYISEIDKQTEIRNEAVVKYNRLKWILFKADLPIFGTAESDFVDFSLSLHSSQKAHA